MTATQPREDASDRTNDQGRSHGPLNQATFRRSLRPGRGLQRAAATGPADYNGRLSLKRAWVNGTVTLRNGDGATVDLYWRGSGPIDKTVNRTKFPGFRGVFTSRERDAVAMGSVVVNGASLISGRSESGSIETLEDKNITFGIGG